MTPLLAANDLMMIMGAVICGVIPGGVALMVSLARKSTLMGLITLVLAIATGTLLQNEGYGIPVWTVAPAMVASLLMNIMLIINYYKNRDDRIRTLLDIQGDDGAPKKKKQR